jgi:hypothetical protein
LPEDFLDGPAPNLTRSVVDFAAGNLTEYDGYWAVILDGVMTQEECDQLVAAAEATTDAKWERALINIGGGMQAMYEDTRKCGRIIWDNRELMAKLWARIEASVPEIHRLEKRAWITGNGPARRNEVWKVSRLNDRARFLKYVGGEYFKGRHIFIFEGQFLTAQRTATAPTKRQIAPSDRTSLCICTSTTPKARMARNHSSVAQPHSTLGT